jgi:hypothetical protein
MARRSCRANWPLPLRFTHSPSISSRQMCYSSRRAKRQVLGLERAKREQSNARETTGLAPLPSFTTDGNLTLYGLTGRPSYTFSRNDVLARDLPMRVGLLVTCDLTDAICSAPAWSRLTTQVIFAVPVLAFPFPGFCNSNCTLNTTRHADGPRFSTCNICDSQPPGQPARQ